MNRLTILRLNISCLQTEADEGKTKNTEHNLLQTKNIKTAT